MDTSKLRKFAQFARRSLMDQIRVKLDRILAESSLERREYPHAIKNINQEIENHGQEQLVERVAYTWFNRFCALRFMDVCDYTRPKVASPLPGAFQPEIMAEAKAGYMDATLIPEATRKKITDLLSGATTTDDPETTAYRLLIVSVCNGYNKVMPYLFEPISDCTELLMPDDLLSGNSILAYIRESMTPEVIKNEDGSINVEVIGWLYQFYISEKKDEVFDGLKKKKKIEADQVPAATQLFTPHWIVRYLVENSLGRLWMLNHPDSRLTEKMDFYIPPEEEESDFLRIQSPEEIKICDPACGSGHMLVYAFDLLCHIYEEEGYDAFEIPELILSKNLFGMEIDERAKELACFALTMKARAVYSRFFGKPVAPRICRYENIAFTTAELESYKEAMGEELFTPDLLLTLNQFEEAEHFGSLIRPAAQNIQDVMAALRQKETPEEYDLKATHKKVMALLRQASYLATQYNVVVANPPYMGGKGMNSKLKTFAAKHYKNSKSDLFAMFIEKIFTIMADGTFAGLMTPFTWMFLSSYEKLRIRLLTEKSITTLIRPEYHAFFDSAFVPICGFTLYSRQQPSFQGTFIDLQDFYGKDIQPQKVLEAINDKNCSWSHSATSNDFSKLPGSPIAYWISNNTRRIFECSPYLQDYAPTKQGLATGDNDTFLRFWYEVSINSISFNSYSRQEAVNTDKKWFPCNKGGAFRKWYGNNSYIVNWHNDGEELKKFKDSTGKLRSRPQNQNFYFREGLTWSAISSSQLSMRYSPNGYMFETKGAMCFPINKDELHTILGYCNSKLVNHFLKAVSPTLDFHEGPVGKLPYQSNIDSKIIVSKLIEQHLSDWNSFEVSWDFTFNNIIHTKHRNHLFKSTYDELRYQQNAIRDKVRSLEVENNHIFIDSYGLKAELEYDVPLSEITLTSNPHYRYPLNGQWEEASEEERDAERERRLLADTMKEFISYAVGCMFGRYSLDKPGLILANQGEGLKEYLAQVPDPTFMPDNDNVIPVLERDWFEDDITGRFLQFLKITFGEANYSENLAFIEKAIGKPILKYFLSDFYTDHVKRYKKRPIYWMFESPKKSFKCLIYMHRYRSDTVDVVLNYLRDFRGKIAYKTGEIKTKLLDDTLSKRDKSSHQKELDKNQTMERELECYERETLFPLATQKREIDLDDGVKENYPRFGKALKAIPGLSKVER